MGYLIATTHLNLVFVWKMCFLIVYITTSAAGRQNANLFSTKKIGNAKDQTGFAQEHPSKSAIHCATSCREKSECQTFLFDKKTKICKLGNASTGSRRMYKKQDNMIECPEQKGYLLWIYSDAHYCIKYNAAQGTQPEAKQVCEDDGGNLVLIDSEVKRLRLHDISRELVDPITGGFIWVDGYDVGDKNKFMSWKGNEVPESEWYLGQPQNRPGEDCMDGRFSESFQLRDADCYYKEPSFCEIELI